VASKQLKAFFGFWLSRSFMFVKLSIMLGV